MKSSDRLNENWDRFRFFLAVARAGSISGAAKRLKESSPTVGRRIRELEAELSSTLFERSVTGVNLTTLGEKVLHNIQRIEHETVLLNEDLFGDDRQLEGTVTVAAPSGLGQSILAPRLEAFYQQSPNIVIELLLSTKRINILRHEADIALRIGEPCQGNIVGEKIGDIGFSVYASHGYLAKHAQFQTPGKVDGHFAIASKGNLAKTKQAIEFEALAGKCKTVLSTDNLFVQLSALKSGLGIAPLPRYLGDPEPDLIDVFPGILRSTANLWILTHPDVKDLTRVKRVRNFLAETCDLC